MHLNPHGAYAVELAASLANDWPATRDEIVERTRTFAMTMTFTEGLDDHRRTRAVIDDWERVVDTVDPAERAALLNAQMAASAAWPRLTDHDGEGWHLHYRSADVDTLPDVLAAVLPVGTALHLTTRGMSRLARCAAGEGERRCRAVVVDTTRAGTRRYCSVQCANRAAVRRHRARRKAPKITFGVRTSERPM